MSIAFWVKCMDALNSSVGAIVILHVTQQLYNPHLVSDGCPTGPDSRYAALKLT